LSRDNAVEWVRAYEAEPDTDEGLFDLVMARLSDIATFLRAHRFSYSGVFANLKGERAVRERYFQLWLAAELQHRSARRYEVVREEEEYAEKRPDLRAHLTTINPTSIELKIAESWTLPELRTALSVQLVGQYMGEVSSQHGVLVLCTTRHQKTWRGPNREVLRLDDAVELLRADAETLLQAGPRNVRRLAIVVLDFRGPLPASRKVRRRRPRAKPRAKKPDVQAPARKRPPGRSIKEPGKKAKKSPRRGRRR
jgi:hypothetical protein